MKRFYFLLLIIIAFSCGSIASASNNIAAKDSLQKNIAKNYVYIELGGSGGLGSLNYERTIYVGKKNILNARIGFLQYWTEASILPVSIINLFGKKRSKLLLGMGALIIYDYKTGSNFYDYQPPFRIGINLIIGYHYQANNGMFYRACLTPLYHISGREFIPWGGISIGYAF